jgi:hypothetical protein
LAGCKRLEGGRKEARSRRQCGSAARGCQEKFQKADPLRLPGLARECRLQPTLGHLSPHKAAGLWLYRMGEIGYQAMLGVTLLPHLVPTQP